MTELHQLQLRFGEELTCELVAVVRNHHENMPGASRDRPGMDRVQLRLPSERGGQVVTVDLWSRGGQDVAAAPGAIAVYDNGELLCWRVVSPEPAVTDATPPPANGNGIRLAS